MLQRKDAHDFVLNGSKEFCIIGAELETNDKTLGPQATIGGLQLDTSCGNKFGPGFVFGDYLVVSGSSKTGGDLNCDLCCDSELDCPRNCSEYESTTCPTAECTKESCGILDRTIEEGDVVVKLFGSDGCPLPEGSSFIMKLFEESQNYLQGYGTFGSCCDRTYGVLVNKPNPIEKLCVLHNQYESFFLDVTQSTREITYFVHDFCVELESEDGNKCYHDGADGQLCSGRSWGASSYVATYKGYVTAHCHINLPSSPYQSLFTLSCWHSIATGWGDKISGENMICEKTLEHGDGPAMLPPPYPNNGDPDEVQLVYYLTTGLSIKHYQASLKETTAWVSKDGNNLVLGCSPSPQRRRL